MEEGWRLRSQRSEGYSFSAGKGAGGASGYTMVEVVVALVILGTTIVAVFGALRNCSRAAQHTRMLTRSVLLAESLLTDVMTSGEAVFETKEGQADSYSWKVEIAPTPVDNLGAVRVEVSWVEQQRPQQYELLSLVYMGSGAKVE